MVYCKVLASVVLSFALIAGGLVSLIYIPREIRKEIKSVLTMETPTSPLYKSFQNSSNVTDVYMTYYVWNITNPEDVLAGAEPVLQELGPYTYLELKYKDPQYIQWHPNATVSYTYESKYIFLPEKSTGTENDVITFIDMGLIGAIQELGDTLFSGILEDVVQQVNMTTPFLKLTVGQALWGYNNTFLTGLNSILSILGKHVNPVVALQSRVDKSTADPALPTASYTGGRAADGFKQPPDNSLEWVVQWNGMRMLPYWGDNYTNMINGTDGTIFFPGISEGDRPYVFVDTLYRSVLLSAFGTTEFADITLIRMRIDPSQLLSGDQNPNNVAFGMVDTGFITRPKVLNEPVIISKPHFLDANMSKVRVVLRAQKDGDAHELYDTYLDVEPTTGQLFKVNKRLQLNIYLQAYAPIGIMGNIKSTYLPLVWVDQHAEAPSSVLDSFRNDVQVPLRAARDAGISAVVLGGALLLASIVYLLRWLRLREWSDEHPNDVRKMSHYSEADGLTRLNHA